VTVPSPVIVGFGGMPAISCAEMLLVMSYPISKVTDTLLLTIAEAPGMAAPPVEMVAPE